MYRYRFSDMECSIARSLELVGEWWTFLILRESFNGVRRFDDMQKHLGIARNVLTNRLNSLVEHGILSKVLYQEKPERYEYRLTDKGRDMYPVLLALKQWGDKWLGYPPTVAFTHKTCGHKTEPQFTCSHCGKPIHVREMTPEPLHSSPGTVTVIGESKRNSAKVQKER
jgi:DNA-binding HxlR family transcriptional regulator